MTMDIKNLGTFDAGSRFKTDVVITQADPFKEIVKLAYPMWREKVGAE